MRFRRFGSAAAYLLTTLVLMTSAYAADAVDARTLSLEACIDIALEKSQKREISRYAVAVANAQLAQARSSFWPQMDVTAALTRMDDDPLFIFPEETSTYTIAGVAPIPIPATVTIPDKTVKLQNKTDFRSSLDLTLPLYTGGRRRGLVQQGNAGVKSAKEAARRTEREVIYDVTRIYYGCVLAGKTVKTAEDALARLEATLELTENLYKRGSGRVKKTDWLKHKMVVETLRSILAGLRGKQDMALSALVNTMGLGWEERVLPSESDLPYEPYDVDLRDLVSGAYRFSPDWAQLEAGLEAADGRVKEAKSGWMPKLALVGQLEYIANDYDKGIVGPRQKKSWRAGVGMQLPLFNGFRTKHEVREAAARLDKLKSQQVLLREGIAIQVKLLFDRMRWEQEQETAAAAALEAASDNRSLNVRAYQDDLVEVEDVVEAQIMESMAIAHHDIVRYGYLTSRARLEFVIGAEVEEAVTSR